jgi:type II secretory pathway pseudopilin PulG
MTLITILSVVSAIAMAFVVMTMSRRSQKQAALVTKVMAKLSAGQEAMEGQRAQIAALSKELEALRRTRAADNTRAKLEAQLATGDKRFAQDFSIGREKVVAADGFAQTQPFEHTDFAATSSTRV